MRDFDKEEGQDVTIVRIVTCLCGDEVGIAEDILDVLNIGHACAGLRNTQVFITLVYMSILANTYLMLRVVQNYSPTAQIDGVSAPTLPTYCPDAAEGDFLWRCPCTGIRI